MPSAVLLRGMASCCALLYARQALRRTAHAHLCEPERVEDDQRRDQT
jgi:hypothetical protein